MKKIFIFLMAAIFLFGCNFKTGEEKKSATYTAAENHKEHEEKVAGLVLNDGAKWKADSTTLLNVALLHNIVSLVKKQSLENYLQTSNQLEAGLSKMVNECKMKGADHDALHHWLEPLIEKTKDLKKVSSIENAATILSEMEKQINLFPQYFE